MQRLKTVIEKMTRKDNKLAQNQPAAQAQKREEYASQSAPTPRKYEKAYAEIVKVIKTVYPDYPDKNAGRFVTVNEDEIFKTMTFSSRDAQILYQALATHFGPHSIAPSSPRLSTAHGKSYGTFYLGTTDKPSPALIPLLWGLKRQPIAGGENDKEILIIPLKAVNNWLKEKELPYDKSLAEMVAPFLPDVPTSLGELGITSPGSGYRNIQ